MYQKISVKNEGNESANFSPESDKIIQLKYSITKRF